MDRGQRTDPNSPLYSMMQFEALDLQPNLLKGLKAMGYVTPSRIQEVALPTLKAHPPRNMIAKSPSGTGKTATRDHSVPRISEISRFLGKVLFSI